MKSNRLKKVICSFLITSFVFTDVQNFSKFNLISLHCNAAESISENGISLIKEFEGYTQYAVWDYHQWSIGYGTGVDKDAYPNGITEAEADKLLRKAVLVYENYVCDFLKKYNISVTQNQYDALVSFTYNLGNVWKYESEVTIRNYLISGISNYTNKQIKDAFMLWCKAGGEILPGLLQRREREADLFLSNYEIVIESGEKWRVLSSTGIRLRKEADDNSDFINIIPYNTVLNISEKIRQGGYIWGKTSYEGKTGWCVLDYSEYISGNAPLSEINNQPDISDNNFEKWRIVSDNGVNLRVDHNTGAEAVDVIPFNEIITVYEQYDFENYVWAKTEYNGKTGWCVLNYASKVDTSSSGTELLGIRIHKLPDKIIYTAGELFDSSGMTVVALYKNGSEKKVEDYGCSGNTMQPGISIITVDFQGAKYEFSVRVNATGGDANSNGVIDQEDFLNIKKHILKSDVLTTADVSDVNGDGNVDIFDSIRAKKEIINRNTDRKIK